MVRFLSLLFAGGLLCLFLAPPSRLQAKTPNPGMGPDSSDTLELKKASPAEIHSDSFSGTPVDTASLIEDLSLSEIAGLLADREKDLMSRENRLDKWEAKVSGQQKQARRMIWVGGSMFLVGLLFAGFAGWILIRGRRRPSEEKDRKR